MCRNSSMRWRSRNALKQKAANRVLLGIPLVWPKGSHAPTVGRILTSPAQQFGAKTEEDTNPNAKMLKMLRHHYHCYRLPLQAILRW